MTSDKYARVAFGTTVAGIVVIMWFFKPDLVPIWFVGMGILLGAYLGFSTVVGGFLRSIFPFFDRRGTAPKSADNIGSASLPPSTQVQGRIEVGDPEAKRRKSDDS